jgi:hypothetical protein
MGFIDTLKQQDLDRQFMFCWNRAEEWVKLPSVLAQPLAPLTLFLAPRAIAVAAASLLATNIAWSAFISDRFVHLPLAAFASRWTRLKWISALSCAAYFVVERHWTHAALSLAAPIVCAALGKFVWKSPIAAVQDTMLLHLGHDHAVTEITPINIAAAAPPAPKAIAKAHGAS